jgi:hypothetical protein
MEVADEEGRRRKKEEEEDREDSAGLNKDIPQRKDPDCRLSPT